MEFQSQSIPKSIPVRVSPRIYSLRLNAPSWRSSTPSKNQVTPHQTRLMRDTPSLDDGSPLLPVRVQCGKHVNPHCLFFVPHSSVTFLLLILRKRFIQGHHHRSNPPDTDADDGAGSAWSRLYEPRHTVGFGQTLGWGLSAVLYQKLTTSVCPSGVQS